MNRIILIGNGFDLAHNIKTSYSDFIMDFWEKEKGSVISNLNENLYESPYYYNDDVVEVKSHFKIHKTNSSAETVKGYVWFQKLQTLSIHDCDGTQHFTEVNYKNLFLNTISKKGTLQNWLDIEYEYYLLLIKCLRKNNDYNIENLNNDFLFIQNALIDYLRNQLSVPVYPLPSIKEKIYSNLTNDYYSTNIGLLPSSNKIFFINFNYTNLINLYIDNVSDNLIHMHGELNNSENPIIFGYGDELDENYKAIENMNDNRYFNHIKSFHYSKTRNYKKMLSFIEPEPYQVYIMGLSCGKSDRTLLNTLFEHKNCNAIKIYYHKRRDDTDNYFDVYSNISRNFNNKQLMRKVVINKEDSESLI